MNISFFFSFHWSTEWICRNLRQKIRRLCSQRWFIRGKCGIWKHGRLSIDLFCIMYRSAAAPLYYRQTPELMELYEWSVILKMSFGIRVLQSRKLFQVAASLGLSSFCTHPSKWRFKKRISLTRLEWKGTYQERQLSNPPTPRYHQCSKPPNFKSANAATNLTLPHLT